MKYCKDCPPCAILPMPYSDMDCILAIDIGKGT